MWKLGVGVPYRKRPLVPTPWLNLLQAQQVRLSLSPAPLGDGRAGHRLVRVGGISEGKRLNLFACLFQEG